MSFKNIISPNNNEQDIKNRLSSNRLIESYLSLGEIKTHPEISSALKNDRKIRFGLLSPMKPKLTDLKGVTNENKQKLINRINSFRKIYFDNCRNQGYSLKEIRTLKKENNLFSNNYKKVKEKYGDKKKQFFADIKETYEKKNYYVPPLVGNKKNLFNGSILLANDNELQNFILYDFGSEKSNTKSLLFLKKIQNEINDKRNLKDGKTIFVTSNTQLKDHNGRYDKIIRDKIKEIKNSKSEIKKTRKTIDLIDDIDFFFNSDNRQYLNKLKYEYSRESSAKISTRVNSAMGLFENNQFINNLYKYQNHNTVKNDSMNNNNNIIHININTSIDNLNLNSLNTENTNITNNINNNTETTIFPLKNEKSGFNLSDFKNIERVSINNNSNINEEVKKRVNRKSIRGNTLNINGREKSKRISTKTKMQTKKFDKELVRNTLERLYEKMTKTNNNNKNEFKFNNQIKKYIASKKGSLSNEGKKYINPFNISNNIENVRQKLSNNNYIKNDIYLRRIGGNSLDNINKLKKRNEKIQKNMNNIEDKMIKILCELNNPKNLKY